MLERIKPYCDECPGSAPHYTVSSYGFQQMAALILEVTSLLLARIGRLETGKLRAVFLEEQECTHLSFRIKPLAFWFRNLHVQKKNGTPASTNYPNNSF